MSGERIDRRPSEQEVLDASQTCYVGSWTKRFSVGELASRLVKKGFSPLGVKVVLDRQHVQGFN
jgi:hypothetical protein